MSLYQPAQSPIDPNRRDLPSYEPQRPALAWDPRQSGYHPQPPHHHFQPQPRPESRHEPPASLRDEEGSDSDVSRTLDPRELANRIISPIAVPRQLPQLSSPRILTTLEDVQARLDELERIEDHNAQKLKRLEAKRRRKDERIVRRRAMEDEKMRSMLDARVRKDDRVRSRRQREDEAFRGADKQLGVEELDLRRRLRSLKRGLPVEEGRQDGGSASAASMSPPLPQSHGGPPPSKRHQSGPPGQNDSPVPPPARPTQQSPASQYHFYQPPPANPPYPGPYHHGPQTHYGPYHGPPPTLHSSIPTGPAASPRPSNTPADTVTPRTNGFNSAPSPVVPGSAPPPAGPIDTRPPPPGPPAYAAPTYDTRPPPPATTGFTSVNAGQAQPSGFATVNPRAPTYATSPPPKLLKERSTPKSEGHRRNSGKSPKNTTPITVGGLTLNKRTPSTTHPYQMSEAFANRHHHCERTDELGRGIWTSYGYMGSQDVPTGPPIEMYLRCNHDDCKRIDWRTVHGLQCHIVKNHGQPKGTIGSLEKALAIYGVPLNQVIDYEKTNGLGSAGQMADPKNQKIKIKTREAMQKSESPASGDMSTPTLTPSASHTSNVTPLGGPLFPHTPSRSASGDHQGVVTDLGPLKNVAEWSGRQSSGSEAPTRANNNFVAVRNTWSSYVPPAGPPRSKENDSPRPSLGQSPLPTLQSNTPTAVQDRVLLTPNTPSDMQAVSAAIIEVPKPQAVTKPNIQPLAEVTISASAPAPSYASTVDPKASAPSAPPAPATILQAVAQIPKEEPEMEQTTASTASAPPQVDKEVVPEEPVEETKKSELQPSTQVSEPTQQPPITPGRRPSRRESVNLSKSAQKDPEAPSMQSPRLNKAENKRSGRRASVAVSTASVSANVSVDGDGDAEKSGDDAEKEGLKTAGTRRNATGRFLRKGR